MGNWKTKYKVGDLAEDHKLELICRKCGRLVYTTKAMICSSQNYEQLYLDEIEKRARCKARGCNGHMRMAMVRLDEMSGFVGGMA